MSKNPRMTIISINDAQSCNITTQIALETRHVWNLCLASSLMIIQKDHVPSKICKQFIANSKSNPSTVARQRTFSHRMEDAIHILHATPNTIIIPIINMPWKQCLHHQWSSIQLHLQSTKGRHHWCTLQVFIFHCQIANFSTSRLPPNLE